MTEAVRLSLYYELYKQKLTFYDRKQTNRNVRTTLIYVQLMQIQIVVDVCKVK